MIADDSNTNNYWSIRFAHDQVKQVELILENLFRAFFGLCLGRHDLQACLRGAKTEVFNLFQYLLDLFWTVTIVKGIGLVHKDIQHNWHYPPPNTTFVVAPLSGSNTLQGIKGNKSTTPNNQIKTKHLSCVHIISKLDSALSIDDDSQLFLLLENTLYHKLRC